MDLQDTLIPMGIVCAVVVIELVVILYMADVIRDLRGQRTDLRLENYELKKEVIERGGSLKTLGDQLVEAELKHPFNQFCYDAEGVVIKIGDFVAYDVADPDGIPGYAYVKSGPDEDGIYMLRNGVKSANDEMQVIPRSQRLHLIEKDKDVRP